MPRGAKCRFVSFYPPYVCFRPEGAGFQARDEVVVKVEEMEAVRLKDHLKLEQEECARRMQVSRPTYQRILGDARSKIADALLNGKAIRVEGGDFCIGSGYCWRQGRILESGDSCALRSFFSNMEARRGEEENTMKNTIAICAAGDNSSSLVDERFGRCPYVAFWQQGEGFKKAVPNENMESAHGAGIGTAQIVLAQRTGVVLTGKIGPKAFAVLNQAGIEVYACSGNMTISDAAGEFEAGSLRRLEAANN